MRQFHLFLLPVLTVFPVLSFFVLTLRINLVALLLTSLSDVCLSNDLQALHELLHHYKVFNKCVAIIQDSFKHSTMVNQTTNVQLTAALLRSFRMTLEKYGNPKAIGKLYFSKMHVFGDIFKNI